MSKNVDDYRGMTAEDFKNQVQGSQQATKETQEPNKPEPQATTGEADTKPPQQTKDADVDQKDINILANTYGVDYESLPENAREGFLKMAKSYREAQAKYTTVSQQAKEREEALKTLENYNSFLEKNPDLHQEIQNRLSGNQTDDKDTPSKPESQSVGKSATVDINRLKNGGYINEGDLTGLDELAKERVIARAELAYLRDQELAEFRKGLENEKKKLSDAERADKVKQLNTQRINDGVDRVVMDHNVEYHSLDDETIDAIYKRAMRILDPADPTGQTIDKDAMYDATLKELAIRGKLPNRQNNGQQKTMSSITDTGVQINKRGQNVVANTREKLYQQKMAERFSKLKDTVGTFGSN